ncbi:MAG: thiol:disulfide interchange protein DsbA/DsbL [Burkholderiales bacterium]|nr:thiol:disulfide interchange protein DsbA/DsbL [Burkholderiales bacterium]
MIGKWMVAALSALAFVTAATGAYGASAPVKDKEYTLVEPAQPPLEPASGKVEVIEFFYYGCPHCYNLQPALKAWLKAAPKDVEFRRMPTIFRESWVPLTRTYYALEAIGALDKFHDEVFSAVHQQNVNLGDRKLLLDWAGRRGIDTRKLGEAYDSFAVQTKTQRSLQLTRAYGITGTPSIVVAGRYMTGPSMTLNADNSINYQRFTQVLNDLVAMARNAPGGKKS